MSFELLIIIIEIGILICVVIGTYFSLRDLRQLQDKEADWVAKQKERSDKSGSNVSPK